MRFISSVMPTIVIDTFGKAHMLYLKTKKEAHCLSQCLHAWKSSHCLSVETNDSDLSIRLRKLKRSASMLRPRMMICVHAWGSSHSLPQSSDQRWWSIPLRTFRCSAPTTFQKFIQWPQCSLMERRELVVLKCWHSHNYNFLFIRWENDGCVSSSQLSVWVETTEGSCVLA